MQLRPINYQITLIIIYFQREKSIFILYSDSYWFGYFCCKHINCKKCYRMHHNSPVSLKNFQKFSGEGAPTFAPTLGAYGAWVLAPSALNRRVLHQPAPSNLKFWTYQIGSGINCRENLAKSNILTMARTPCWTRQGPDRKQRWTLVGAIILDLG